MNNLQYKILELEEELKKLKVLLEDVAGITEDKIASEDAAVAREAGITEDKIAPIAAEGGELGSDAELSGGGPVAKYYTWDIPGGVAQVRLAYNDQVITDELNGRVSYFYDFMHDHIDDRIEDLIDFQRDVFKRWRRYGV